MNTCLVCDTPTINAKFCSQDCSKKGQKRGGKQIIHKIICGGCNQEVVVKDKRQKFCSKRCSALVNNSKRRKVELYCKNCDEQITRRNNTKYCSQKCQQEFDRSRRIEDWLESGVALIGTKSSHYIRKFLLEEQKNKCDICGCDPIHNGKPLIFILDHISGNASDNTRQNLRMICPNCDTQLSTFAGRNLGNGRFKRRQRYQAGLSS